MDNPYLTRAEDLDLLRETARRLFAAGATDVRSLAELGFTGLLTPETSGGSGWLPIELTVIAEEAGRALSPVALAGATLAAAAATAAPGAAELVVDLLQGSLGAAVSFPGTAIECTGADRVTGPATVLGSGHPEIVLLVDGRNRLVLVDARIGATVAASEPFDTTRPSANMTFDAASAAIVEAPAATTLLDAAALLLSADSLGALSSSTALVTEHLTDRHAFERPLASFQALQHRLADLELLETSVRALLQQAAMSLAARDDRAPRLIAALHAVVALRIPRALDECIQLAGGVGFTWEWPLHHAMRRALVNGSLLRPAAACRGPLLTGGETEHALDEGPEAAFRARARQVIRTHMPHQAREGHTAPTTAEQEAHLRHWYRLLYHEGLCGASWPIEYGGDPSHQLIHQLIVTEELIRARAPRPIDQVKLSSHVLIRFGTDAQKARYLPRIREGADVWCQLFSEPDAGSDLAGLRARAERTEDGCWLLSGQKTWTTDGHWAQMGLALLRTSSEAKRHAGITAFLVPMDAPGLEIVPKRTMGGAFEFNDVFLDGVVLAPDSVLGGVGAGWSVAMSGLEVERLGIGGNVVLLDMLLDDVVVLVDSLQTSRRLTIPPAEVDQHIADLVADALLAKAFVADHVDRALVDREAPADGSISKVLYTEAYNRISRYGAELAMSHQPLPVEAHDSAQHLIDSWLWSRSLTISGGSSEVMRNIIAKRRLHLPQP